MSDNYDRVADWDVFAKEMHDYIESFTVKKYGGATEGRGKGPDLLSYTEPRFALWNALKYCIRMINGRGKRHDHFKIVHYIQIAVKQCNGDLSQMGINAGGVMTPDEWSEKAQEWIESVQNDAVTNDIIADVKKFPKDKVKALILKLAEEHDIKKVEL